MISQNRINADELEFADAQSFYNGVPFTGVGFRVYPNLRLEEEIPYKDGYPDGVCREWFANGQMKAEWFAIHGRAIGKVKQWHQNGKLKSVGDYEHGVELKYDEWSDGGTLLVSRTIDAGSELYKYLQHMRTK